MAIYEVVREKRLLYPKLSRRTSFTYRGNGTSKESKKEIIEYALMCSHLKIRTNLCGFLRYNPLEVRKQQVINMAIAK